MQFTFNLLSNDQYTICSIFQYSSVYFYLKEDVYRKIMSEMIDALNLDPGNDPLIQRIGESGNVQI